MGHLQINDTSTDPHGGWICSKIKGHRTEAYVAGLPTDEGWSWTTSIGHALPLTGGWKDRFREDMWDLGVEEISTTAVFPGGPDDEEAERERYEQDAAAIEEDMRRDAEFEADKVEAVREALNTISDANEIRRRADDRYIAQLKREELD